jgi:hypothetical protein
MLLTFVKVQKNFDKGLAKQLCDLSVLQANQYKKLCSRGLGIAVKFTKHDILDIANALSHNKQNVYKPNPVVLRDLWQVSDL